MRIVFLMISMWALSLHHLSAQKTDLGSWNILNLKYILDNRWSVFAEGQIRSLKFYNHYHYYEYKGGFNFKAGSNVNLSLGGGNYQTYKEGGNFVLPMNNDEFRIWPQLILSQSLGKIKIEHRYRAEFRFSTHAYRNRFRYRLGLSYPFGRLRNDYKAFQLSLSDEIFFSRNEPYFERNRILLAFNYKPSKGSSLQIGYLHQFDYKINDEIGRDFLQIAYYIEISRKRSPASNTLNDIKSSP